MKRYPLFLTDAQLKREIAKCEFCLEKPCKTACPADCSPADFIMAAKLGADTDFQRASSIILGSNPLGGICGSVCPDYHCMKACALRIFDRPIEIPSIQSAIIARARESEHAPVFTTPTPNNRRIAIVGAGPAGLGAASVLAQLGYAITIFEQAPKAGGMCNLIPEFRLNHFVLQDDIELVTELGNIEIKYHSLITDPVEVLDQGYQAVIVATGLNVPFTLGIPGENLTTDWKQYLENPEFYSTRYKNVIVIGGGAIATDCAVTASRNGATKVTMIALEKLSEMPLTDVEWKWIHEAGIEIIGRSRITEVREAGNRRTVMLQPVDLPEGEKFHPRKIVPLENAIQQTLTTDLIIIAIGAKSAIERKGHPGIYYAGDLINGPTTVVEAVASGKNIAIAVDAFCQSLPEPQLEKNIKSTVKLLGKNLIPVNLETDFFGRKINSPFLLSAAPPTDGLDQMIRAYRAGWAGGVMKTAFDNLPIHIPSEYMFVLDKQTFANCDNVSGHALDRVCREIEQLVKLFPDRLTIGSTGGPVTGNDESDKKVWQSNTRKLEAAGAMAVEYSLSCPQGGDGTKGDIVSQDAELTATIIDWVMSISDPEVPKLFKLTGAVTAIQPILIAIREVLAKYPHKKAGVTLANSFPALSFRPSENGGFVGYIVGMSGAGVAPISFLTLAKASNIGLTISGNGGPMDYLAASHFLALGAKTVQFCSVAMKYGVEIIDELNSGFSYLLQENGYKSVAEYIGSALPDPILSFEKIPAQKKISSVDENLCQHCGNCVRCPYLAIMLSDKLTPVTDPSRCVGCSFCVQKCFSGALSMRNRSPEEHEMLSEN